MEGKCFQRRKANENHPHPIRRRRTCKVSQSQEESIIKMARLHNATRRAEGGRGMKEEIKLNWCTCIIDILIILMSVFMSVQMDNPSYLWLLLLMVVTGGYGGKANEIRQ